MKPRLITAALLGVIGVAAATPVCANNRSVESALANYSDLSTFYQALITTGVAGELQENVRYTVFAPTNEAFAEIQPHMYPCFYSVQCRAQVADVLRDHIVVGRRTLNELADEAEVPTIGHYSVYVESPYVGDYTVADRHVLSGAEVRDSMIYRIDGVILTDPQLAQFQAFPPLAHTVTQKTVTTYRMPAAYPVPGGGYPAGATEMITEKTYAAPGDAPAETIIYPDEHAYVVPDGGQTTVTRTITTQP